MMLRGATRTNEKAGTGAKTRVGQFKIERILGEGGIGRVYEATDEDLGRRVALKALKPEVSRDKGFVERFRAEAVSLARLHHPNITTLYSLHRDDADLYMVMELVSGLTLEDVLERRRRLGLEEVVAITAMAASGLGYAHRMGVIHRDIKPANLMLTEGGQLKIMDFGIARIRGSARATRAGSIIGTPVYMPPEQINGADNDERSDVYSLGCVVYELLCGSPPFHGETEFELMQAHVAKPPVPPRDRGAEVDPLIEAAILRALAKAPADRFATVPDFARALGSATLRGEPADIAHDRILARITAPAARATRVIGGAPAVAPRPPAAAPPAASRVTPAKPAVATDGGIPVAALVLGGAAAVVAAGLALMLSGVFDSPDPAPIVAIEQPTGPTLPATQATNTTAATASVVARAAAELQVATAQPASGATTITPSASPEGATPDGSTGMTPAVASVQRSVNLLPAPDNGASMNASFGDFGKLKFCAANGGAAAIRAGQVTQFSREGWPIVDGQAMPLRGIEPLTTNNYGNALEWIKHYGGGLACCPDPAGRSRCFDPDEHDFAKSALRVGWTRMTDNAPPEYRAWEQKARDENRGVWKR